MRRILHRTRTADASEESVWISFSDLMTSLLTVFMLAAVVLVLSLTQKEDALADREAETKRLELAAQEQQTAFAAQLANVSQAEKVRAQMLVEIRDRLSAQGIEVTVSKDSSVLSIPTAALGFDSGSYEIRPEHQGVALAIGEVISDVLRTDERFRFLDTVFVEGHTDNQAFDGLDGTGNWGLSTFRAISLWRLWDAQLPGGQQLDDVRRDDGRPLFSVSGYGDSRPVQASQTSEAEKAANRRIDIRFTETRLTADDLAAILDDPVKAAAEAWS